MLCSPENILAASAQAVPQQSVLMFSPIRDPGTEHIGARSGTQNALKTRGEVV